jgi:hypothetical protein
MPAWDIMRPARSVRGGGQRPRSRLRRGRRRCNRESEHRACRRSPSNRVSPGSLAPRTKPAWPLRRLPPRCGNSSDVMNASLPSPMKRVMRWQRSSMWWRYRRSAFTVALPQEGSCLGHTIGATFPSRHGPSLRATPGDLEPARHDPADSCPAPRRPARSRSLFSLAAPRATEPNTRTL